MTKSEKPPTIDVNSPLQRGHRWIWVPVLTATIINIIASGIISWAIAVTVK